MNKTLIMIAAAAMTACSADKKGYDATGTFEATEVTVSAEQNGRLMQFDAEEGKTLKAGEQVALIDTVQLYLKAMQIGADKEAYASERPDVHKQIATLRQQLANARQERDRYAALVRDGAANRKMLDDAENSVSMAERQLAALKSQLGNTTRSLNSRMSAADIQRWQVADQLRKCHVRAPLTGTVLETYAERGEYAAVGKPLFKMADMDNMFIRAYITTTQLERVAVGKTVSVFADYGAGNRKEYKGRVAWISDRSEFTPKTILTDDERADLVYAVKIAVRNDGGLKIGMYGEIRIDN